MQQSPAPDESRQTIPQTLAGSQAVADMERFLGLLGGGDKPTASGDGTRTGNSGDQQLPADPPPGYEILGILGRGGMGVVYRARHRQLDCVVALKLILAGGHVGLEGLARFQTEAKAAAALHHPCVVPLLEFGEHRGLPYFTLEYVPGGSLADRLRAGPLPPSEAVRLVEQIARGVHHAHTCGVLHRDLKPGNVLLAEDGTPRITDFGLARRLEVDAGLTPSGAVMGTPSYMAPEQARGETKHAGPAADVYGLGAILYECLTGRPPFQAATAVDTILQVLDQEPVSVRQLQPRLPVDVATICHKCLHKEPQKRYASAQEVADDCAGYLAGKPIRARPVGRWEKAWRWCRRNPTLAGLLAVSLVAGGTLVVLVASLLFNRQLQNAYDEAATQRERAESAKSNADSQRLVAEKATAKAKNLLYVLSIERAYSAWRENDVARADQLLADCRAKQPPWEWRYLYHLCHSDLRTLQGHAAAVTDVRFSPDGQRLASASEDKTVRLWDAATGRELRALKGHTGMVFGLCFSPDGQRLASAGGGPDPVVRVWDTDTGRQLLVLRGHTNAVTSVCFSPDGKHLASGSYDQTVRVWDAQTGQETLTLKGHTGLVLSVSFSPDGKRLASGSGGLDVRGQVLPGEVKVWNAQTGAKDLALVASRSGINSVCFSPDGKLIACAGVDQTVHLLEVRTGQKIHALVGHSQPVTCVCFSADSRYLASAGFDQTIRVWTTQTGALLFSHRGHTGPVKSVCFRADGKRLASASSDRTVRLWDAQSGHDAAGARVTLAGDTCKVHSIRFSPDSHRLAGGDDRTVRVWDVFTEKGQFALRGHKGFIADVAFSPDGQRLASAGTDKTVRVWSLDGGQELCNFSAHTNGNASVCFSPDGQRLAGASAAWDDERKQGSGGLKVWELASGRELLAREGLPYLATSICFSPDGSRLAGASYDGTVKVWAVPGGHEVFIRDGHTGVVECVCFSPDGKLLASGGRDGTVRLWDGLSGEEVVRLEGHTREVKCVGFSPDGQRLVSASADQSVRLWDVSTGQEVFSFRRPGPVHSVCWSPDGQRLASASWWDRRVTVWDAGNDFPK